MNCIKPFVKQATTHPTSLALWDPKGRITLFRQLRDFAASAQHLCIQRGVKEKDRVLLFGKVGPSLYAGLIALLGLCCEVIFVEPWMPLSEINTIIHSYSPKIFLADTLGTLWGLRSNSIRQIPLRISFSLKNKKKESCHLLYTVDVKPNQIGTLTFTTGTTGKSKGVVRTHASLLNQMEMLSKHLPIKEPYFSDLCPLPGFAMLNLARGTPSLLLPKKWDRRTLRKLTKLPDTLQPRSVTCGPGFLKKLIKHASFFPHMRTFHIGGALTDCSLFEKGFSLWPEATWTHVYGSSEAEPVSKVDAKEAVKKSREKGYFQTLFLGKPIEEIATYSDAKSFWVSGCHVNHHYLGNENTTTIWHRMDDRIWEDGDGLWYQGRSHQSHSDFLLEQEIYSYLGTSNAFVTRDRAQRRYLLGEKIKHKEQALLQNFPELHDVIEMKIYRDRRHQARIDRKKTKRAAWIVS